MGWFHCQVPRHDQNICSQLCHSAVACWAQRLEEIFNFRSVSWHRRLWFLQISLAMIISRRMMENACTQSSRWMLAWWHIYIYIYIYFIFIYNYITIIYIYIFIIIIYNYITIIYIWLYIYDILLYRILVGKPWPETWVNFCGKFYWGSQIFLFDGFKDRQTLLVSPCTLLYNSF